MKIVRYKASNGRWPKHDIRDSVNRIYLTIEAENDEERRNLAAVRDSVVPVLFRDSELRGITLEASPREQKP